MFHPCQNLIEWSHHHDVIGSNTEFELIIDLILSGAKELTWNLTVKF